MKVENPEEYAIYLEKQRARSQNYRKNQKKECGKGNAKATDIRTKQLEKHRERQKKYVLKLKQKESSCRKMPEKALFVKPVTRKALCKKKKEYNRLKKREERAKMTYQKKMWVRKKDRERKAKKREKELRDKIKSNTGESPFPTKKTEWNVTTKVRSMMPSTPKKFEKIVENLLFNFQKRKCLNEDFQFVKKVRKRDDDITENTREGQGHCLVHRKSKQSSLLTTAKSLVANSRVILTRKMKQSLTSGKGKTIRSRMNVKEDYVRSFYKGKDISRILPQKRYATKEGPGYAMQVTLKVAFVQFLKENPFAAIGFSKFASLRPKNVRKLNTSSHREYCCCIYCVNVRFKLLALSKSSKSMKKKQMSDLFEMLLCEKSDCNRFFAPECIHGTC